MNDKLIRASANNGKIRIIACTTKNIVEEVRNIHKLNELTTIAFGKFMTAGVMMSSLNKTQKDFITMNIECDGAIKRMNVVTRGDGTLKGFISNPKAYVESLKISDVIGKGTLTITKDFGLKNPYSGNVPLISSEIATDLAYYFSISEQTPTAIAIESDFDEQFNIKKFVGLMVQMFPGANEKLADIISFRFEDLGSIVDNIKNGNSIEDVLNFMFDDMGLKILEENNISYKCDCSREKVENAFISIGKKEFEKILDDCKNEELVCHYCGKKFIFTNDNIKALYRKIN